MFLLWYYSHNERGCGKRKQDISNGCVMKDQYGYWIHAGKRFNEGRGYRDSGRERGSANQGMKANRSKMSGEK